MNQQIAVLDRGYVRVVETWGRGADPETTDCEVGIIEAARQSTQGSFRGWQDDSRLLKFLYDHQHNTPFEFAGMVLEIQAPIFVFREWQRHRTQSYNEMSARYSPLPDLYYLPSAAELVMRSELAAKNPNRQASSASQRILTLAQAEAWRNRLNNLYVEFERLYQAGLIEGVPKELARIGMPVGHYSRMRAAANLRNWLAFLTLRTDPAAQREIRLYAYVVAHYIETHFPRTAELAYKAGRIYSPE